MTTQPQADAQATAALVLTSLGMLAIPMLGGALAALMIRSDGAGRLSSLDAMLLSAVVFLLIVALTGLALAYATASAVTQHGLAPIKSLNTSCILGWVGLGVPLVCGLPAPIVTTMVLNSM
jgi:hypothetical protein